MEKIIKGEIPFVRILIPLIAGIGMAYLSLPSPGYLLISVCMMAAIFLLLMYLIIFYKKHYNYHQRWFIGLVFSAFIFLAGYNLTGYKSQNLNADHFSKNKFEMLIVTIRSDPKPSGDILRFEAEVKQGYRQRHFYSLDGKLLVALKTNRSQQYQYGDLLLIPASYSEVDRPYNPAEFNYKAYLAIHGIHHQTFINDHTIHRLKSDQGNFLVAYAFKLRQRLVKKFNKYVSDRDAASVASTLILGYRSDLSKEVLNAYSTTGTLHVLSVSGMHVGIVFIVMLFILKSMDRNKQLRLIRAVLMIVLIWFYAIVTGFSPSVCRAALMISFVIIGKAIQRHQNTYNLLAISAVFLLIYDPFFLFDVGFQLSYLAVLGLVYLYPKIYGLLHVKNWLGNKIWDYTSLSSAAQLATFPLSIYYFHQFPLYFLLSNLFIIIPVAFIMYTGLLFLFFPWDFLLKPLGWLLNNSITFLNQGLFYIENLPFASISGIWINALTYLLIYGLIIIVAFAFVYKSKKMIYSSVLILFILVTGNMFRNINLQKQSRIVFYSLKKNTGVGFFEGKKAIILTDLEKDEKTFSYAIQPSVDSGGIQHQQLIKPGASLSVANFFSDGNFIQFRDWKLLIWNKNFDKKTFLKPVSVQVILLQDNPEITIKSLMQYVNFKILLIDGSNPDYRIKNWEQQAIENGIDYYILKKNPAYIVRI